MTESNRSYAIEVFNAYHIIGFVIKPQQGPPTAWTMDQTEAGVWFDNEKAVEAVAEEFRQEILIRYKAELQTKVKPIKTQRAAT